MFQQSQPIHQSIIKYDDDDVPLMFEVLPFEGKGDYTFEEFQQLQERIVSHQQMMENYKVNTWETMHYYETVTVDKCKSAFLDNNEEYQGMITMIEMFNAEVLNAQQRNARIRNGMWRLQFFRSLANVIREISFFTRNRELQAKFITRCYNWALETITKIDYQSRKQDSDQGPTRPPTGQTKRPFSSVTQAKRPQSALTIKSMRPQSGYPTTVIDGYAETTIEQTHPDRPDSGVTGTIRIDQMKESQYSKGTLLPGDIIQDQLHDYQNGFRTKHDSMPPPDQRLTNYKRRIIQNFQAPRPQSAVDSSGKIQMKSTFPKPIKSAKPTAIVEEKDEEVIQGDLVDNNDEILLNEEDLAARQAENEAKLIIQEEEAKKKERTLEPQIKVFLNDEQVENNQKPRNLDFETRDGFQQYQNSNQSNELNIQKKYQKLRNKEAQQKREDEELVAMMHQWSSNKARVEREMNRRIESATYGNRFRELEMKERQNKEKDYKELDKIQRNHQLSLSKNKPKWEDDLSDLSDEEEQMSQNNIEIDGQTGLIDDDGQKRQQKKVRPQTCQPRNLNEKLPNYQKDPKFMNNTDFRGLESQISKHNINKIKKLHGNIIGLQEEDEANRLKPEQSMSIYGKQLSLTQQQKRPLSAILAAQPLDQVRYDQLQEIEEIKLRLAKKGVAVPVQKLVNALLIPDPINLKDPEGNSLPPPGFGMKVDPFAKKKKSKKKKRSKK
ncbi:unnamed protein product [Paramecium pentaurelia]|uniref:Uncharacterized protein n=1 Tax=Paramecium pentaurelia TaxID=43138 RepID=A0A8S1U0L1_9CILI|nr:unnamed protein product [Paramecium pentaurelia]